MRTGRTGVAPQPHFSLALRAGSGKLSWYHRNLRAEPAGGYFSRTMESFTLWLRKKRPIHSMGPTKTDTPVTHPADASREFPSTLLPV